MKEHTYADPSAAWGGFRPTAYGLDVHKVASLPLSRVQPGKQEHEQTTILELPDSLKDRRIESIDSSIETEVTTDTGLVVLKGLSFNRAIFDVLLGLQKDP